MNEHPLRIPVRLVAALTKLRDKDTGHHQARVAVYTRVLAEALGLGEERAVTLELLASVHDVGKIAIKDSILLKPGRLDRSELEIVRTHATAGMGVIDDMIHDLGLADYQHASTLRAIVRSHHERWDGKGYPDGLKGASIPFEARIVCVADVWDALTEFRLYRPVWTSAKAKHFVVVQSGKQFDPVIVKAFVAQYPKFLEVLKEFRRPVEERLRVD